MQCSSGFSAGGGSCPSGYATAPAVVNIFTSRLPWQPASIKFTQCVSGQKSVFSPLQEKLCVGSKNNLHLLEFVMTFSISMQSLGEIELRTPAVGAKIVFFCISRLVCLHVGDIVQTSIV